MFRDDALLTMRACTRSVRCRRAPGSRSARPRADRRHSGTRRRCVQRGVGNLEHPRIIERLLRRIEIRIGPDRAQFGGADRIRPVGVGDIDGVADRRQLAVGVRLAVAGPRDVIDLLMRLAVGVHPALDDLDAVEIGADRIAQRIDHEARRLRTLGHGPQVAAHRYALFISHDRRHAGIAVLVGKSQPPNKRTIMRGPVVP